MNLPEPASSVLAQGILPAIIAWLAAKFALSRFRSERLWEKQLEMYRDIVEALHDSREFSRWHMEQIELHREPNDEEKEKVRKRALRGHKKVQRAADIGRLLISRQAIRCLDTYIVDSDKVSTQSDWYEYLDEEYGVANKALRAFMQIARQDLRI